MQRERVEKVLEKVRAGLQKEGGDIELVDVRDTVVYVRLMSMLTMKNWVESSIRKEMPEITSVQAVS
jgi:Fe-S cluster biogenesis protein NfuA